MVVFMYARASRYYGEMRRAAGLRYYTPGKGQGEPGNPAPQELHRLLNLSRPMELAVVGVVGLIAIVWLMVMKPF